VEKPENVVVLEAMATRAQTDDEKEKAWRRLLKVDPNYAVAYNMLGYLELARGNFEESEEFLQKIRFPLPRPRQPPRLAW
jgi:Flp pilus assembly protein TadD